MGKSHQNWALIDTWDDRLQDSEIKRCRVRLSIADAQRLEKKESVKD